MSYNNILSSADIKKAYMLLGECRLLGKRPSAWVPHIHEQLSNTLGIQFSVVVEGERGVAMGECGAAPTDYTVFFGDDDNAVEYAAEFSRSGAITRDALAPVLEKLRTPMLTISDTQYISTPAWRAAPNYLDFYKPSGYEHVIRSRYPIPGGQFMLWSLWRPTGDKSFTDKDIAFMTLVQSEICSMLSAGVLTRLAECPMSKTSPRVRQVARLLCEGLSEKQVALKLGIRPTTCHGYVKTLHKTLNVSSRAELILKLRALQLSV